MFLVFLNICVIVMAGDIITVTQEYTIQFCLLFASFTLCSFKYTPLILTTGAAITTKGAFRNIQPWESSYIPKSCIGYKSSYNPYIVVSILPCDKYRA